MLHRPDQIIGHRLFNAEPLHYLDARRGEPLLESTYEIALLPTPVRWAAVGAVGLQQYIDSGMFEPVGGLGWKSNCAEGSSEQRS